MPKKLVASRARFQRAEHISVIGSLLFTIWGFTIMFNHAPWLKSISNSHVKGEYKTSETNDKGDRCFVHTTVIKGKYRRDNVMKTLQRSHPITLWRSQRDWMTSL